MKNNKKTAFLTTIFEMNKRYLQDFFKSLKNQTYKNFDIIVVNDEKVIATEDNQGTKKMLSKLKKGSDRILIKLPKKKQDLRMDLPTVGLNTLKDCKKYGLKGIVLKSKKNIFLDKVQCIKFANKNKIFIKIPGWLYPRLFFKFFIKWVSFFTSYFDS